MERSQQTEVLEDIEKTLIEPLSSDPLSILWDAKANSEKRSVGEESDSSVASRIKKRKKKFNLIACGKNESPTFSTENIYTFEVSHDFVVCLFVQIATNCYPNECSSSISICSTLKMSFA